MFSHKTKKLVQKAFVLESDDSLGCISEDLLKKVRARRYAITFSSEKYRSKEKVAKIKVLNECEEALMEGIAKLPYLKKYLISPDAIGYKSAMGSSKTEQIVNSVVSLMERQAGEVNFARDLRPPSRGHRTS